MQKNMYKYLAPYYDEVMKNYFENKQKKVIDSILKSNKFSGSSVADIACGTGSVALYFASMGYKTFGLDLSKEMLQIAKDKADEHNLKIKFSRQDIRNFTLPNKVDLITCNFDSLSYILDTKEMKEVFQSVSKNLNPKGLFIFDLNTIYGLQNMWYDLSKIVQRRGLYSVWKTSYDEAKHTTHLKITLFAKDRENLYKKIEEIHIKRGYDLKEILSMLEESNFDILETKPLTVDTLEPVKRATGRIIYVARKH